jgi:hypothetical protein
MSASQRRPLVCHCQRNMDAKTARYQRTSMTLTVGTGLSACLSSFFFLCGGSSVTDQQKANVETEYI